MLQRVFGGVARILQFEAGEGLDSLTRVSCVMGCVFAGAVMPPLRLCQEMCSLRDRKTCDAHESNDLQVVEVLLGSKLC